VFIQDSTRTYVFIQIYMHEDEDILLEESFEIQASVLHSCVWT